MLAFHTPPCRVRDVLPLPLLPVGAALTLLQRFAVTRTGLLIISDMATGKPKKQGRQQLKRLVVAGTFSGMNDDWKFTSWKSPSPTPSQTAALEVIDRWVGAFCHAPSQEVAIPTFRDLVNSRTVDYSGDEVGHALPLRPEELEPGCFCLPAFLRHFPQTGGTVSPH